MAQTKSTATTTGGGPKLESNNKGFVLVVLAVVVIGLAGLAFVIGSGGDDETATGAASGGDGAQTAAVELVGDSLERLPADVRVGDAETDPMHGQVAPTLVGTDFSGAEVRIEPDGSAKAIYFVAHWCPHCQEEVPLVQSLIDDGSLPEGIEIYAVSTAVDSGGGNYPPVDWFDDESFSPVVVRDDDSSSAIAAFGGASFPYVVYLDGDHRVVARSAGSLDGPSTVQLWELAASS